MESKEKNNLIFVRLFPNEDIYEELKKVCQRHQVKTAVIVSGLGQLKEFELGYFKEKGNYTPRFFSEPHELLSLSGNVLKQGEEYLFHLHAVLGNARKEAIGGHLIKGKVSITNEIVLLKTDLRVERRINEKTGLKDLFLGG